MVDRVRRLAVSDQFRAYCRADDCEVAPAGASFEAHRRRTAEDDPVQRSWDAHGAQKPVRHPQKSIAARRDLMNKLAQDRFVASIVDAVPTGNANSRR